MTIYTGQFPFMCAISPILYIFYPFYVVNMPKIQLVQEDNVFIFLVLFYFNPLSCYSI